MLGLGQIRAYRILSKPPRHLPRHTQADVALFRVICWGAILYFAFIGLAYAVVHTLFRELSGPLLFPVVIPACVILLFCWWTTDVAPRFARWSVSILTGLSNVVLLYLIFRALPSLMDLGIVECLYIAEFVLLVVYFGVVTCTALRQLAAIRQAGRQNVDIGQEVT